MEQRGTSLGAPFDTVIVDETLYFYSPIAVILPVSHSKTGDSSTLCAQRMWALATGTTVNSCKDSRRANSRAFHDTARPDSLANESVAISCNTAACRVHSPQGSPTLSAVYFRRGSHVGGRSSSHSWLGWVKLVGQRLSTLFARPA